MAEAKHNHTFTEECTFSCPRNETNGFIAEDVEEMSPEMIDQINHFAEQFDELCQIRHDAGAEEYGHFTFIGNDVIRMMCEELADTANYARAQFVKLMILNNLLANELEDNPEAAKKVAMGTEAFKGTKKGWNYGTQS